MAFFTTVQTQVIIEALLLLFKCQLSITTQFLKAVVLRGFLGFSLRFVLVVGIGI